MTARTVAVWCDGKFEDNVSYALKDTPCGEVVGKSVCCFPANVCQFFPRDQVLQDLRADSYVGVTLWDHAGKPIGLIAAIGRQPLANRPLAEDILQLVAVRAAGEMERMDAEEVLRKNEELFRTLTAMAPVGVYLTTPEGHCEYVNPCWCEMAGIDLQEALGECWIKGLHPEDRSLVFSKWQQMTQSEGQWGLEYRFQTPDKKTTWVYGLATPVRNDSGRIIKYIGINTDITERKRDEEALRESEERFRSYIEHSPYGVFVADGQGRYVDVNPAAERITGYSAAQLTSMSISDFLTAESRESGLNHFQTLVAEGRGRASTELGFRRADGSLRHWSVSATRIGPDRYLGFVEDITERRMAEERLQRFRRIVSSTSDGIALLDEHYRYLIVNEAYETFSGKKQEDVIGLTVSEYLGEAIFCERIKASFDRCLNGEIIKFQEWFDYPALGKRFVEITYCPYIDARGNVSGVVANTRDITERKQAEAALQANRKRLADIIEFLPDATLAIDKERRVIIWNKAIEEMTGIPATEMIGKNDYAYTIPFYGEARPQLMDLLFDDHDEIAAKYPKITREGDTFMAEVFCNALYNNKGAWVMAKASPLHDPAGNIIGAIESIRDITEHKLAEEKLREITRRLQLATSSAMAGVWDWDLRTKEMIWDDRMIELYGLTHENFPGGVEAWEQGLHPDDSSRAIEECQAALRGERDFDTEFRVRRPDGTVIHIKANGLVLRDEQKKPLRMIG
ncbi:MAG: PAS domain S-box protein, partial [Deltaproteobacteria bacterium]